MACRIQMGLALLCLLAVYSVTARARMQESRPARSGAVEIATGTSRKLAGLRLPQSKAGQLANPYEKPFVSDVTGPKPIPEQLMDAKVRAHWPEGRLGMANRIVVDGKPVNFGTLAEEMRKELGPENPDNRMKGESQLSRRSVLIRCDAGQAFAYVKGIMQLCSTPEIAVWRVRLAVEGQPQSILRVDLPTQFGALSVAEGKENSSLTIKLQQVRAGKNPLPRLLRDTQFDYDGIKVAGASRETILGTIEECLVLDRAQLVGLEVILETGFGVPYQRVVEVLDLTSKLNLRSPRLVGLYGTRTEKNAEWFDQIKNRLRQAIENETKPPRRYRRRLRNRKGGTGANLLWLASAQAKDGHWPDTKDSVTPTCLSLLALLGVGVTHKSGDYRENVRSGLMWLLGRQKADGSLAVEDSRHALATLTMCEAYRLTKSPLFVAGAQRGLKRLQQLVGSKIAGPLDPNADAEFYGWAVLALRSAHKAGLEMNQPWSQTIFEHLAEVTDEATGIVERDQRYLLTTVALLTRVHQGHESSGMATIRTQAASLLGDRLPTGDANPDMFCWLFGTIAAYHAGGAVWGVWKEAVKVGIVGKQKKEGLLVGTWDPQGSNLGSEDRVIATALMSICSQIYYRFGRAVGAN